MPTLAFRLLQPLGLLQWDRASRGSALAAEPYLFALRRLFRTALCGDGEADHLK
jgi:hypothetical protein